MPLDLGPAAGLRTRRGALAHRAGLAAEEAVARDYVRRGRTVAARRWRGRHGEIDLVAREGETVVFVEVKAARTHDIAALRLGGRQIERLCTAALEYLGQEPRGLLTECRFDLALVDRRGAVAIVENAFGAP